jgi:transglutaminase-like putative cysteine protease
MLQALPLMLVLFFMVPRIGSLWAVPLNNSAAKTGMSDSMAPGDFAQLMRSRELAFRVSFDGDFPRTQDLYWRGLVFSSFDGRRWSQAARQVLPNFVNWPDESPAPWRNQMEYLGRSVSYSIMLEPTQERWLYVLSAPVSWDDDVGIGPEFRLQKRNPVRHRVQYRVTSSLDYRYEAGELDDWQYRQELQMPYESNPETRAVARRWMREAGSPRALIERLLGHYRDQFRYTLQPGALGRHPVDEFLWQTRAGFCEHFASSFVFFMRAAGIPARVVVGYQGGEINPLESYLLVRQQDAHAWAEVWLDDEGWVRIDPTAAVAPERIERGIEFSLDELDSRLLSGSFARDSQWLNQLRLRWDLFNYSWNRWVLGYDTEVQSRLLTRWLGGVEPWRVVAVIIGLCALMVGAILLHLLWRQRHRYRHPADRTFARFAKRLERAGYPRTAGEGARAYAARVAVERPGQQAELKRIAHLYELVSYAGNRPALADLRRAVARFRLRR